MAEKTHVFCFNPEDNGGEALTLKTVFYDNDPFGDGNRVCTVQEISLESYRNSATFSLMGASITPEKLRELADQLEDVSKDFVKNLKTYYERLA